MEEDLRRYAQWCYELLNGNDDNASEIWASLEADGFIGTKHNWMEEDEDE